MVESNTIEALTKALSQDPQNTNNTYNAVVSRVDNENVVWVHIAGSDKETPTTSTSAEVERGDVVQVEWRNNRLYIAGNSSNPSAGVIRVDAVERASETARMAADSAVKDAGVAREAAESVKGIAEEAQRDADSAKKSATTAINQLGYIEDVVGTLNWIAEHGEYSLSTDTEVQDGKLYFNRVTQEELIQLPYSEDNPTTINGITYTVASDGSITANGTATADSEYGVKHQNWTPYMMLDEEEYKLVGCPQGGGISTYSLFATYGSGSGATNPKYGTDTGNGTVFTGRTNQRTGIWIVIKSGVTVGDLVFTPSLKLNIADSYEVVTNPTGSPSEHGWYELTSVDEAVSNYVAAHLALTDEGLYVQTDREEGWRVLIKGDGVYIIDDEGRNVAKYKHNIVIGNDDGSQTYLYADFHSLRMIDKEGDVYMHISDLRDSDGYVTEHFVANGDSGQSFVLSAVASNPNTVTVKVNNVEISSQDYTITNNRVIVLNSGVANEGDSVDIRYDPNLYYSQYFKAYTFGKRAEGATLGWYSVVEGADNKATQPYSHAEGHNTTASGRSSHAEGNETTASGYCSHAEGHNTTASGYYSHAEGFNTTTSGYGSHAEGHNTTASGLNSHAEGYNTTASGTYSHAQNDSTTAGYSGQTAIGRYNDNKSNTAFEIGNGSYGAPSNAFTVDWDGTVTAYPTDQSDNGKGFIVTHGNADKGSLFLAERTDTNVGVMFGVGTNGTYHGIWSNTANKWLVHFDNNLRPYLNGVRMETYNPSASVTASVGTVSSVTATRYGNIVHLSLSVNNTASVPAGSNIFEGTLNTTALRPTATATGATYVGQRAIGGLITSSGGITIRNSSSSALTLGGNLAISFFYIVE